MFSYLLCKEISGVFVIMFVLKRKTKNLLLFEFQYHGSQLLSYIFDITYLTTSFSLENFFREIYEIVD